MTSLCPLPLFLFPSYPPHPCSPRHLVLLPSSSPTAFPFQRTILVKAFLITLLPPPFLTKLLLSLAAPLVPQTLCFGLSQDGATSAVPLGLPPPFPLLILSFPPQTQAPLPFSPHNTHLCNSTPAFSTHPPSQAPLPTPSPSPGLVFSLWSREPRREGLVSSRTTCSSLLHCRGSSVQALAEVTPGDSDWLVPV